MGSIPISGTISKVLLMKYKKELSFLKKIGCKELPHSDRTLYDHLYGTAEILIENNRPDYEVKGGLFHSIYGTERYKKSEKLNITRENIKELLGDTSEQIVYIFCNLEERCRKITQGEEIEEQYIESLRWIEYANLLEQNKYNPVLIPLRIRLGIF
jgi:hypothetical protein|tara:strand:+ start:547 stop:1014 length:468 start_codon:yes stop_codon:yes gene_type:complete